MKPAQRQALIIDILHQHGSISVKQLCAQLNMSPETIRRDLNSLAINGRIHKTHGGATLPRIIGEGPLQQRLQQNIEAKRQIASIACDLIHPGDTLFIDTGSTTIMLAEQLNLIDDLTIITNSADIARIAAANNTHQVFLLGGLFNADNRESTGPMAITQIAHFRATHALLTIGAIHATAGITDYNVHEAQIAQTMIEHAQNIIVLCDDSKLDQIAPFEVTTIDQLDYFVCNTAPGLQLAQALESAQTTLLLPD